MDSQAPSQTAFAVARMRAGHQILDGGAIFSDPFACPILGEKPELIVAALQQDPNSQGARAYMATRSRIGEDWLEAAYQRGTRQVVILGAGFDTFGLRNVHADLNVFEVDHRATQCWKREKLGASGLQVPTTLRFVPVDFRTDELVDTLSSSGFDALAPAFFLWLGVVPYLTRDAVLKTLSSIATVTGAEVAFDYSEPLENFDSQHRPYIERMAQKVAAMGEPWLSYFDPAEIAAEVHTLGFSEIEDLDRGTIGNWASKIKSDARVVGPHLIRARRISG